MAIVKQVRCDLCGEYTDRDKATMVMVGKRELRTEDFEVLDIGEECQAEPLGKVLVHARNAVADVTGGDREDL